MKTLQFLVLCFIATASAHGADTPTMQSLVGREFTVHDDWAGQELAFVNKGGSIIAVWRVLGSGRPVLSEVECPVEIKSPRQCVFELQLREGSRSKVKVEIGDHSEVRAYLNGIRIQIEERKPNKRTTDNSGASPLHV